MSSRLHNKFHRHNHHTTSTNDPRYPDAGYDPIASYEIPFNGPFVVQGYNTTVPTTKSTSAVAIEVAGDIVVSSNGNIIVNDGGILKGNGAGLYGVVTTSVVNLSGSPYQYSTNAIDINTTALPSLSGVGNSVLTNYSVVAGGSANKINGLFSFIACGSSNNVNHANTFILGSNITTGLNSYTYVNNLSSLGYIYATTIGASSVNAKFLGDGSLLNLTNNPLSAATRTLVNAVSTTLNASITSLSAVLYAPYFNITTLNAVSANLGTTSAVATLNVSPLTITGAASGSVFNQIRNITPGVSASTDISLYNDDGINYLDLGIVSTKYNGNLYDPAFNVVNAGDSYVYATSGNLVLGAANTLGNLAFFTGGALSGNERMRINSSGNVGIGTNTPNQNLTVVGNISATNVISASTFNASNGFYSTSAFGGNYTDGIVTDYVTGLGRISVGPADALSFYNGGPANTANVTIDATGKVGIGTKVPNQNLTVVGNVSATGTLTTKSVNVSGAVNAGDIYSNGTLLVNSGSQYTYYRASKDAYFSIGNTYGNVFDNTDVLPNGLVTDTLLPNSTYHIIYDILLYTDATQTLTFAITAGNAGNVYASGMANYLYNGSAAADTATGAGVNPTSSTSGFVLPLTTKSVAGNNNMYIRALINTGASSAPATLIVKNTANGRYCYALANSYRTITRIA